MVQLNDDCGSCKEEIYNIYIDFLDPKIWLVENLSIFLCSISEFGFTKNQSRLVAESILDKYHKYKIFTGDKDTAFKIVDIFVKNNINVSIIKKAKDIFK